MKPLVPYIRQSKKREQTISIEDQRAMIRRWAKLHPDVTLGAEVVEQGVSGSKHWKERELGAAITAIQDGRAGGLIVAFQDRLSRESGLGTAEVWAALGDAGARLVCTEEGLDTANGDQELNFGMRALMAREGWKRFRKNWANADDACAANGIVQGPTPVGFTKLGRGLKDGKLKKNADHEVVRRVFECKAAGGSYKECRRILEDAGVKTGTGLDKWGGTSIRSMLRNPIYKGVLSNGSEHVHEPYIVVSPSVWQAAQSQPGGKRGPRYDVTMSYDVRKGIVTEKTPHERTPEEAAVATKSGRQDAGDWAVLGGLVACGGCGRRMSPNVNPRKLADGTVREHTEYRCSRIDCDHKARATASELEEYVVESAYGYFEAAVAARGGAGVGKDRDSEEIGRKEHALDAARESFKAWDAAHEPTDPGYAERIEELRGVVKAAEVALAEARHATRRIVSPAEMRRAFEKADVTRKRALVREMLNRVTVNGARKDGPTDERTDIDYRVLVWDGEAA